MHILFKQHNTKSAAYTMLGKTLMLCQRFEHSVKFVINVTLPPFGLSKEELTLEDIFTKTKKGEELVFGLSLDRRLQHRWLKEMKLFSKRNLTILNNGKESRNYLCHEAAVAISHAFDNDSKNYIKEFKTIKFHLNRLCVAYALIAEYDYQIQTKEHSRFAKETYAEELLNWIYDEESLAKIF